MAKARKKSHNDISRQFDRIWRTGVENSDEYKIARARLENMIANETNPQHKRWMENDLESAAFRNGDARLRRGAKEGTLSEKDRRINDRINRADKTTQRYLDNIDKSKGFSEMSAFAQSEERRDAYFNFKKKRYSYARRAGISG